MSTPRFPVILTLLILVLIGGMCCWTVLFAWPINGDETSRLLEASYMLKGNIPFLDVMLIPSVPGFWLLEAPILLLLPPRMIPWGARALGLLGLFISIVILYFICSKLRKEKTPWTFFAALSFLALCPELIFKVAECRPDGLAASLFLAGAYFFFTAKENRQAVWGALMIGAGASLKLEMGVLLLPFYAIMGFGWKKVLPSASRGLTAALPPLVMVGAVALWTREHSLAVFSQFPLFFQVAKAGKGPHSLAVPDYEPPIFVIIAVLAMIQLFIIIRSAKKPDSRYFSFFVLSSVALIFLLHQSTGAKYHQNYWSQIFFLAPFAGKLVVERLPGVAKPVVILVLFAGLAVTALIAVKNDDGNRNRKSVNPMDPWLQMISMEPFDESKIRVGFENRAAYTPAHLSYIYQRLNQTFPDGFSIYANDFRVPFGDQIPRGIAAKISTLEQGRYWLLKTEKGRQVATELYSRFPQGAFVIDGRYGTVSEFIRKEEPDVLIGDDYLWEKVMADGEMVPWIKREYRLERWAERFPVFVRNKEQNTSG